MLLINKIKQEVPMLLQNSWYLDDGILVGTEAELMHTFEILESEGKDLGLNVKTSKCMLWSPQTMSSLDQNIKLLILNVLKYSGRQLERRLIMPMFYPRGLKKIEPLLDRLQQLGDPHAAYGILKICFGTPNCCTLYAQLSHAPQLPKFYLILTMHRGIA